MTPPRRRTAVAAALVAVLLAGCSSVPVGPVRSSVSFSTDPPSSTTTAATASNATSPSPVQPAGTLTVSDNSGNTGRLVVSFGTIQPANQISDPVLQACAGDVSQLGSSFERTLAVPFAVQVQLTSTLSSDLTVNLANEFVAAADGPPGPIDVILLAKGYSAGPECADPAANARVKWQNASPGVSYTWRGYILEPNAITPNDPSGAASDLHRLLLDPLVILSAGSFPTINYDKASSPSEVLCQYPMGGGSGRPLLAIDPSTALNYGCSPA